MALTGPVGKDNLDISFRLNSKAQVFNGSTNHLMDAKVNICASASSLGIVFVGSNNAEIIVLCLKDLESPNALEQSPPVRKVSMPSPLTQIATNCDGSILAVDVNINGTPHIQLYSTSSFLTPNIQKLREFRVSPDNACSAQLCWNPVINSTLAVCTSSGGLNLYSLKDSGVEFHSIDPNLKVKCCCWSPKGKQIVAGFANGKLIQFNMELKSARVIECPPGIFATGGNFETIAVQWLSTYQFAIALSSQQDETRPVVYILNAPKAGPQQYIAYNDVCYSTSEVRPSKIYLQYIQQWGMILIASANCVDVSFLKISKPSDIPEWTQEFPNDQFPAELPLTPDKEESFPIGFDIDIATQGKLMGEDGSPFPVMPMLHMLSTNGVLCSFYVFNTTPSYVDICSPPRPIDPRILQQFFNAQTPVNVAVSKTEKTPVQPANPAPFVHSTPATVKSNLFGSLSTSTPATQSQPFSGFSLTTQPTTVSAPQSTFSFASKPVASVVKLQEKSQPNNEPLITVSATYNPPPQNKQETTEKTKESSVDIEDEKVYMKMIEDEMKAFELEFNFVMEKSKSMKVRIGTKEESAEMRRSLEELDELKKEAMDTIESLRCDVQANRLGLTEMFAMLYEAKAKCEQDDKSMILNKGEDRSTKRKLANLQKMVQQCEIQVQMCVQLLQSQWSNYQEQVAKNKKNRMHIPSLEGVYETLKKQQEIVYQLRGKVDSIKSRLGICDDVKKIKNTNLNSTIESLSDSIISMSLVEQVEKETGKINPQKLDYLRKYLASRPVTEIKPKRPEIPGLNSEVIIEKKANALKLLRKKEEPKVTKSENVTTVKPTVTQTTNKPLENTFNVGSMSNQKTQFAAPPSASQQPAQTTQISSKKEEPKPFSFPSSAQPSFATSIQPSFGPPSQPSFSSSPKPTFALNTSASQTNFALNTSQTNFGVSSSQPTFGLTNTTTTSPNVPSKPSFSLTSSVSQPSFSLSTSSSQPSFSFSSTPLVISAEKDKKKEEPLKVTPQPQKSEPKPASTISSAPVAVTANFSVPLTKTPPKENVEKDAKPAATTETTSFTFSLPGKKETAAKSLFGSTPSSNVSENVKNAFSFGSSAPEGSFSFGNLSTTKSPTETKPASTTSASIFGGTPVTTTASSGSIFSGSSFSLSLDSSKTPSTNIFATKSEESKSVSSTAPSIFSSATTTVAASESKSSSTFSFASFGTSIAPSTQATTASTTPVTSTSIFSSPKTEVTVAQPKSADSVKSLISGVNICSPDVPQKTEAPTNIFGSSSFSISKPETTVASSFGNSSFGSAVKSSAEVSSPASGSLTSPTVTSPSIFGSATAQSSSGSLFGSLSLGGTSTDKPSTNIFTAKPDQSVFGASSPSTNIFGAQPSTNIFGASSQSATTPPTNIFGSSTPATTQSSIFGQSSSIFAQSTATPTATTASGSIFSQNLSFPSNASSGTGIFGQSSSIFGQSSTPATTNASIFGQSSTSPFGAAATSPQQSGSIFGGSATSPFGASTGGSIFSSGETGQATFGGSATFSSSFGSGGSIFGQQQQQPTFGGGATFGSPKSNIFNSPPQSPSTGNIFEQLGQQQTGNLFGNLAGQTQQQPQAPQGGVFSGSAFSSWR